MRKLMWPKAIHWALLLLISVTVFGVAHLLVMNGEAYEYGRHFVANDPRVVNVTGRQTQQRLSLLSGFHFAFGDFDGEASLTLRVKSERGTFEIPIELKKERGKWHVVSAKAIADDGNTQVVIQ